MELISKKDLLEQTGISYGQLYRWKRKELIPEEWFIRKSTFTGQETFFPKEKIVERIDKIRALKDELSLDELANMFAPGVGNVSFTKADLLNLNIVSQATIHFFLDKVNDNEVLSFDRIFQLAVVENLLNTGDIHIEEGKMVMQLLDDIFLSSRPKDYELLFIRKHGISSCLLCQTKDYFFEKGTKVVAQVSLMNFIEDLKTKLR
ncbi:YhbD family protein [Bacillaceae bacterium Marseille-Q3522]|nr:YhbD family protein [Bacillaceae bacterium Marseille-Q3522]